MSRQVYDARASAKSRAEFLTPPALQKFIADQVQGERLSVLDPAIGSGQLVFEIEDRIDTLRGFDVSEEAVAAACANFEAKRGLITCEDFITHGLPDNPVYDYAISNYPFSLRPTDAQKIAIKQHPSLWKFYQRGVSGVLDFVFILKSFLAAREGLYLCFPGIGYRAAEKKFRAWLIENNFVQSVGLLENCRFEHTAVLILFLHLKKTGVENPTSFRLDLVTGKRVEESAHFTDDTFAVPRWPVEKKVYDPVALEREARAVVRAQLERQVAFSDVVWELDESIRQALPSPTAWRQELITFLRAEAEAVR